MRSEAFWRGVGSVRDVEGDIRLATCGHLSDVAYAFINLVSRGMGTHIREAQKENFEPHQKLEQGKFGI